jgi:hypothetical protein
MPCRGLDRRHLRAPSADNELDAETFVHFSSILEIIVVMGVMALSLAAIGALIAYLLV